MKIKNKKIADDGHIYDQNEEAKKAKISWPIKMNMARKKRIWRDKKRWRNCLETQYILQSNMRRRKKRRKRKIRKWRLLLFLLVVVVVVIMISEWIRYSHAVWVIERMCHPILSVLSMQRDRRSWNSIGNWVGLQLHSRNFLSCITTLWWWRKSARWQQHNRYWVQAWSFMWRQVFETNWLPD